MSTQTYMSICRGFKTQTDTCPTETRRVMRRMTLQSELIAHLFVMPPCLLQTRAEKYSDARLNSDEFNDTFIHICLYIDTDPDRARQLETGGDEEDDVAGYFIRAVGACPPVTLNHHSHCRPYKLKLHLPLPPPSPFLLPLHPSPFTKLHLPSLLFPTNSYCSDILQIETTSSPFPNFSLPFQ